MATNEETTPTVEDDTLEDEDEEEEETDLYMKLIYLVKDCPFIYDVRDPQHKDRILRERTWSEIAAQVDLSVEDAKCKWQRLRNNFLKAIERRQKIPRSGSAATKLLKPWTYEADMEFIRCHLNCHRLSSSSLKKRKAKARDSLQLHSSQPSSSTTFEKTSDYKPILNGSATELRTNHSSCTFPTQAAPQAKRPKAEVDSAIISLLESAVAKREEEDPAVGWFKSLLPMFNTLSHVEKLEFQSKVTLELSKFLIAKEQQQQQPCTANTSGHFRL